MSVQVDSQAVEQFFFQAMKSGWATPVPKSPIPGLPGSKSIPFRRDDFTLIDYYFVASGSNASYGSTVIWVANRPVWVMHYGGWYKKEVIPFLKAALREAYSQNQFFGGRGPQRYTNNEYLFLYCNKWIEGYFGNFHGLEYVLDEHRNQRLGEHRYFGGLMI